ncbi:hypothetical protein IU433_14875 [Nocardia puris]|uniref:hypothetical protein n=1 Tax=Nocardia puris TaxID=208602 RepID=UPI001892EB1B|nr:hypothetical protein [Nocardia puris]MBF6214626.1 hypothetical protein [Nocardia puris]MBF6366035.1 hypothetical protein [Nocardia puris]MBF6460322.1 hypothetical protein [Nocardia puris]
MVVIALSLVVVAAFALGFMLGRHRSTPRPPGRHSVAYFEMASETTMELPVVTEARRTTR